MFTRREHGWSVQDFTDGRRGKNFKADLSSGHDVLPMQAGALPNSQPPAPDELRLVGRAAADDAGSLRLIRSRVCRKAEAAKKKAPRRRDKSHFVSSFGEWPRLCGASLWAPGSASRAVKDTARQP
jgi:hypothetical protein